MPAEREKVLFCMFLVKIKRAHVNHPVPQQRRSGNEGLFTQVENKTRIERCTQNA